MVDKGTEASSLTLLCAISFFSFVASLDFSVAGAAIPGRVPGTFAVSPTGAATYTIPIWAPPGPGGIQPNLALTYNSQQRHGYIGVGWTLSGMSSIYRCDLTYAQDSFSQSVSLLVGDGYCLDGQRLRLTSGTYGVAGSTYQTEVANYINVTAYGTAGNGPAYFVAKDRSGNVSMYGTGGNSQVLAPGTSTALSWQISHVSDPAGNTMTFAYNTANGTAVPATISWAASSYGSSTYNYSMTFSYGTNSAQGSFSGYVATVAVSNTNLLNSITVAYSGTTVKKYVLGYQASSTTGRQVLSQVQECSDAGATNCLGATTLTYQPGAAGVTAGFTSNTFTLPAGTLFDYPVDINGDGHTDRLYAVAVSGSTTLEHWWVVLGTGTGPGNFGPPIDTGATTARTDNVLFGDLMGTGRDGILYPANQVTGTWNWAYLPVGSSTFVTASTGISAANEYGSMLADVNGDGLPDLIYTTPTDATHIYMLPNTTAPGGSVSFGTSAYTLWTTPTGDTTVIEDMSRTSIGHVRVVDFNGDGRADLIIELQLAPVNGRTSVLYYALVSNGGAPSAPVVAAVQLYAAGVVIDPSHFSLKPVPTVFDWNDDGCTDVLVPTGTGFQIALSPCSAAVANLASWPTVATDVLPSPQVGEIIPIDWDGDGRTDLFWCGTLGPDAYVALSTGNGIQPSADTGLPLNATLCASHFEDVDGDGLGDLTTAPGTVAFHNAPGQPADLLTKISDGYGNSVSPTYVSMVQSNYSPVLNAQYPAAPSGSYKYYMGPLYVVNQVTFSDPSNPPNGTYQQTFSYFDAQENLQGRGFSGFGQQQRYDSRNGLWDTYGYCVEFPCLGMLFYDLTSADQAGTQQIRYAFNNLMVSALDGTANNQRYFPYFNNMTVQTNEVSGAKSGKLMRTVSTSYSYDSFGNPLTIASTTTDNDSSSPFFNDTWTTTVTNTTAVDTGNWCLGLFTQVEVTYTASIGGSVTRTKQLTPDTANCRYTQVVTEPASGAYKVTESFGYDSFGNINSDTLVGAGMAPRQTITNWGTTGQFATSVTDPAGATTQYVYNMSFGLPSSMTDANGLLTSWVYDGFGRKIQENRPNNTSTVWNWPTSISCQAPFNGCGLLRNVVLSHDRDTAGNNITSSDVEFDPLDRPFDIEHVNEQGAYSDVTINYDSLGRVASRSAPFIWGSTQYLETYSYDALNRLIRSQRPTSATNSTLQTTSYQYQGGTETLTDANGHSKTLITDVNGWLRQTQDATGYAIILGYDAAGSHTSTVDSQGTSLWSASYQYGIAAFMVSSTDADLGTWSYTFDALGEKTAWHDAKGQSFSAVYDVLSRMTDRYEPDLYAHWSWGTGTANNQPAYNIGLLQAVCTGTGTNPTACTPASGYAESATYDQYSRLGQRSIQIPGDGTYTYAWSYSPTTGYLDTLTYPANPYGRRLQVKYTYANGFLHSITDVSDAPNVAFWTANAVDGGDRYLQETLGNNVILNHGIDAATGQITSITAGLNGGAALQNNSYLFDPVGNLIQRQDNNAATTENVYMDALNRLDHTVGDSNTQLSYDAMGRLASWGVFNGTPNVNDYTTQASGCSYYANAQPHAVRQSTQGTGVATFCRDANGNKVSASWRGAITGTNTWTSFNQPNLITSGWPTINTGTSSSQFSYDQAHQRWQQVASYSGAPEATIYIGGLLEKVTKSTGIQYRHYIPAGNSFVIYIESSTSATSAYYATKDHLGSTAVITDQSGALVANEKFSATGIPETDSQQAAAAANITRHAYTGQELEDNLNLTNLNGRMYASSGMILLSPDPNIPDASDTRSYNRYAYVEYNPLTEVDPTGFYNCDPVPVDTSDGDGSTERGNDYQCGEDGSSDIHFPQGTNYDPNGNNSFTFPAGTSRTDIDQALQSLPPVTVTVAATGGGGDFLDLGGGAPSFIRVAGPKTIPIYNMGWELVGLDFITGIVNTDLRFRTHIRPRHAADAKYPQSPRNGRFYPKFLSMATQKDQFDQELGLLFNEYTPIPEPTRAGIALDFTLPGPVGLDLNNLPTNSWTVVITPMGSGIYQVWTTYPGHPVLGTD